jgi:hypothetical protein
VEDGPCLDHVYHGKIGGAGSMNHIRDVARHILLRIQLLRLLRRHMALFKIDAPTAIEDTKGVIEKLGEGDLTDLGDRSMQGQQ